jgi:small-conductance mechanosensitive channel
MGWLDQKEAVIGWIKSWEYSSYILNQYSYAAFILFGFVVLSFLIRQIYKIVFLRIAKRTKTDVDDKLFEATKWPLSLIVLFFGIKVSILPLELPEKAALYTNHFIDSVLILIISIVAISIFNLLIDSWGKKFTEKTKSDMDDQLLLLFHRFVKVLLFILAFLFILQRWGIQVGPLLASLGIAGIAIGFALKDSLSNIIGGIQLIVDKTFCVGDKIEMEDGTLGVVKDISLRSTRIRTYDNELIIVPNGKFATENIKNHVQPDLKVRVRVPFGVVYGSDPKKVKKVVLKAIKNIEHIMDDPEPAVLFMEMADFSLNFRAQFWVPSYEHRFMAKIVATELIYDALNKAGIGIPFPTRTLYIHEANKKKKSKNKK